jgi:putative endonuclease
VAQQKPVFMSYAVYVLKCVDGSLYTGITTDVKRRFKEHQAGIGSSYTRAHKPKKIVYTEKAKTRSAALKREAEIKRLGRAEKLVLIKNFKRKK